MHRLTRRRALDAAAKVTLSLSAFACGARAENARPLDGAPVADSAQSYAGDGAPRFLETDGAAFDGLVADASVAIADASIEGDLADSAVASPTACNAPPPPAGPDAAVPLPTDIPADTASCCLDYATQRVPDGGYRFSGADLTDPGLRACCAVIIDTHPNVTALYRLPVASPCCSSFPEFARIQPYFLACTPWGPPVPPAMPQAGDDARGLVG